MLISYTKPLSILALDDKASSTVPYLPFFTFYYNSESIYVNDYINSLYDTILYK